MDEYNRTDCLPTTRLDVIKSIIDWITDESSDRMQVLWLYGPAGSGKSALATTIAWRMRDLHRLGAFFFFNRGIPERNAVTLIRTLAYQLSRFDARIGTALSRILESMPHIADMPLEFQFANLLSANVLESVEWRGGPIILIIDALDECGSDRKELLQVLSRGFKNLPSFIRVMVVSREEPDIEYILGSHPMVSRYALDIDSAINQDIATFIRYRLNKISMENEYLGLDSNWPGEEKVGALVNSAN